MTTLVEMRERVRNFVRDTNEDEERRKVSDEELDVFLRDALAQYSLNFPKQKVVDVTAAATISLPSDALPFDSVQLIEINKVLWTEWVIDPGKSLPSTGNYWYWRGDKITFAPTPTSAISVWYRASYPFPVEGTPAEGESNSFTLPGSDEELIEVYAAAKFHQKLGTVAAKLDRFKERGERDDSPLVMMHDLLFKHYDRLVAERRHHGSVRIRRA